MIARITLLTISIMISLAGCGKVDEGRTVVHFWAMGHEAESVARLIPEFEREHPHIDVQLQTIPWSAAHSKLLTAFVGNVTPDVSQVGNSWIPELAAIGAIQPLDDKIEATPDIIKSDYFSGIWSTNIVDDHVYGLPWYVDTRVLFYRRDLLAAAGFDHPPANWGEWRTMLMALSKPDLNPGGRRQYGIFIPTNEFEPLLVLGLQQDAPLLRDNGRYGNFRSAGFGKALEYYHDLFNQGLAPPISNQEISNLYDEFARGYFAFYISGPWNVSEFKKRMPSTLKDKWMTAPMPGPDGPGASTAGGSSLVLFNKAGNKEAAWTLIAWLSKAQTQAQFHAVSDDLPARRSAWEMRGIATDPYMKAFARQLENVRPSPPVPEWERIATEMQLAAQKVARGDVSVADAQNQLDAATDKILARRRWLMNRKAAP